MTQTFFLRSAVIGLLACTALGCVGASKPGQATAERVDNASLGLSIAKLPEPFVVITNENGALRLEAPGEASSGVVQFEVADEEVGGVNLVAEAEASKDWFEAQSEGQYFGNLELMTPLGTAFTARGSYEGPEGVVEELRVFALHPSANRLLKLNYRYPPGEGRERMQQMAELLGEIEALAGDTETQEASSASPDS